MAKCPICGKTKTHKQDIIDHIEQEHIADVPENMSIAQFIYSMNHGREYGLCRVCGEKTEWNEKTGKPRQLCNKLSCKDKRRRIAQRNMLKVYGTDNLLKDPLHQEKMLANRKISGKYKWSDNSKEFTYTGSYEKFALEWLDKVYEYDPEGIQMPGPIIYYDFKGEKKPWITDMYLPDMNLVIEFKDGSFDKNTHPGFNENRLREAAKDEHMRKQTTYNYVKITNKNMLSLINAINLIRMNNIFGEDRLRISKPIVSINESIDNTIYEINKLPNSKIYEMCDNILNETTNTTEYVEIQTTERIINVGQEITDQMANDFINSLKSKGWKYHGMSNSEHKFTKNSSTAILDLSKQEIRHYSNKKMYCETEVVMSVANLSPISTTGKFEEINESPLGQSSSIEDSTMMFGDGIHSAITDKNAQGLKTENCEPSLLDRLKQITEEAQRERDQMFSNHEKGTWNPLDSSDNFQEINESGKSPKVEDDEVNPQERTDIETDPLSYGENEVSAIGSNIYSSNFIIGE